MQTKNILSYVGIITVLLFTACQKTATAPNGGGGGGNSSTTITYVNDSYTPISITVNGSTQTIAAGQNVVFKGTAGATATGQASTSGITTSNTQVGLLMTWTLNNNFPTTGNFTVNLDVPSTYFFLKIINNSTSTTTKLYVNYGLTSQTLENISMAPNTNVYNLGYYLAYTNSNVRLENATSFWYFSPLNLPFVVNQQFIGTAN
jgi:hypothetical protein